MAGEKILDLSKSVYDICMNDAIAKSTLLGLGFKAVAAPKAMGALRNRKMEQIMPIRGKSYEEVLQIFEEKGYTIINR